MLASVTRRYLYIMYDIIRIDMYVYINLCSVFFPLVSFLYKSQIQLKLNLLLKFNSGCYTDENGPNEQYI